MVHMADQYEGQDFNILAFPCNQVRGGGGGGGVPATRSILEQDGPDHLGFGCNAYSRSSNGPNHLGL